jgi:hypothetical protein
MNASVFELRRYTLHPGRRNEFVALFEREFVEPQEALGMSLPGLFCDAGNPDRFIWLRGFEDMQARREALTQFYGGPIWKAHRDAANGAMIDSDDVFLLRPAFFPQSGEASVPAPLFCATYLLDSPEALRDFATRYSTDVVPSLAEGGGTLVAAFETETSPNDFPALPVRSGEYAFVTIVSGADRDNLAASDPAEIIELIPTMRSRIRSAMSGKRGDFDFLVGQWSVTHRTLRERLRGSDDWETFTGPARAYSLLDGVLSVDEFTLKGGLKGSSIRTLDAARQRWSIHWTTNASGRLFAPVYGGFDGDRGEFFGADVEGGRSVLARYKWWGRTGGQPRWEQAFSTDGGREWETNWVMTFERAS